MREEHNPFERSMHPKVREILTEFKSGREERRERRKQKRKSKAK